MDFGINISIRKRALFFLFLWFIPIWTNANSAITLQEVSSAEYMEMAENAYYEDDFKSAIKFAKLYLGRDSLSTENREMAHILLTHVYLAVDDTVTARENVINILDLNAEYAPTLEMETPKYVNFVLKIREQHFIKSELLEPQIAEKDSLNFNWYIIGGTGLVLTTVAILLLTGDEGSKEKDSPLALPPGLPQ